MLETTKQYVSFAFLLTALLFAQSGLYADRAERPGLSRIVSRSRRWPRSRSLYAVVNGEQFSSYYIFYGSLFFAVAFVASFRFALRAADRRRSCAPPATAAGRSSSARGDHIESVAHALEHGRPAVDPRRRLRVAAAAPEQRPALARALRGPAAVVTTQRIDEVIIADPAFPEQQAVELVDVCHQRGVRVRVAPSTMEILVHRAEFIPGQSVPLFELKPPGLRGLRLRDQALVRPRRSRRCSCSLLSPVLLACALAVQLRARGAGDLPLDAPGDRRACRSPASSSARCTATPTSARPSSRPSTRPRGALFKIRDDPRMTPVGRFLRRFSLDELPQLFNVVRGEMSLVGPRPLPERDYERLEDWHKKRYLVMPGITGLWQISGRSDLDFDDLVRLDFLYLERWSVFLDLSILLKTVPAVFLRRGSF